MSSEIFSSTAWTQEEEYLQILLRLWAFLTTPIKMSWLNAFSCVLWRPSFIIDSKLFRPSRKKQIEGKWKRFKGSTHEIQQISGFKNRFFRWFLLFFGRNELFFMCFERLYDVFVEVCLMRFWFVLDVCLMVFFDVFYMCVWCCVSCVFDVFLMLFHGFWCASFF